MSVRGVLNRVAGYIQYPSGPLLAVRTPEWRDRCFCLSVWDHCLGRVLALLLERQAFVKALGEFKGQPIVFFWNSVSGILQDCCNIWEVLSLSMIWKITFFSCTFSFSVMLFKILSLWYLQFVTYVCKTTISS